MAQTEVLTRSQANRRKREALAALRKLVAAPQRRELLADIELGNHHVSVTAGEWGRLYIAKTGLVEHTGYNDSCVMPSDCSGMHNPTTNKSVEVKPSMTLAEDYSLTAEQLKDLLAKLRKK